MAVLIMFLLCRDQLDKTASLGGSHFYGTACDDKLSKGGFVWCDAVRSLLSIPMSNECLSAEHGSQGVMEQLEMHRLLGSFSLRGITSIQTILTAPQSWDWLSLYMSPTVTRVTLWVRVKTSTMEDANAPVTEVRLLDSIWHLGEPINITDITL